MRTTEKEQILKLLKTAYAQSEGKETDAILDDQGYFNVINNEGDPQFVDRMAVFKFKFCPLCGDKLSRGK